MNLSVHNLYTVIASESEAIQACKLTIDEWRCHGVQTSIVSVDVGRPGWSRHLESLDCFALARNDGAPGSDFYGNDREEKA